MPIQYKTMTELREKTASVLRAAQRADVVITVRGKPKVMLQRISRDEVEGLQFLESSKGRRLLSRALSDVKAGRTVPLEQLIRAREQQRLLERERV
jgi:prevent-host-death family protein